MFGFFNSRKSLAESGLLKGSTDNHSHILYGVDDGVKTLEESLQILSFLETSGVKHIWLTPHVMEDVPNTTEFLRTRFEELKSAYHGGLELSLASENMIDSLFMERLKNKDFLLHEGNRLLVETSTWSGPMDLWDILDDVILAGYTPVLAHPERYRYMTQADYDKLRDMGVLLQLNLPSILGVYGEEVAHKAEILLEKGMYCMTGSDCHRARALEGQTTCKILSKNTIARLSQIMCK